jgi:hypothetical protein
VELNNQNSSSKDEQCSAVIRYALLTEALSGDVCGDMNLYKLMRFGEGIWIQPDSDQYWEAAAWHYNKYPTENQRMNHKSEILQL